MVFRERVDEAMAHLAIGAGDEDDRFSTHACSLSKSGFERARERIERANAEERRVRSAERRVYRRADRLAARQAVFEVENRVEQSHPLAPDPHAPAGVTARAHRPDGLVDGRSPRSIEHRGAWPWVTCSDCECLCAGSEGTHELVVVDSPADVLERRGLLARVGRRRVSVNGVRTATNASTTVRPLARS